jgi:hypothetical protein
VSPSAPRICQLLVVPVLALIFLILISLTCFDIFTIPHAVATTVRLHGEASDVDINAAEKPMNELRDKLRDFRPENIFNMNETGLFFRTLPNRSYVLQDVDSRQFCRGSKTLTAKDRVTLVL